MRAFALLASDVARITILMVLSVTPRNVAPPLLPVNFAMQGAAYSEKGICRTPCLHSKPPIVLPLFFTGPTG